MAAASMALRRPLPAKTRTLPASGALKDLPIEGIYGTVCVVIDVPQETALPDESLQDNKTYGGSECRRRSSTGSSEGWTQTDNARKRYPTLWTSLHDSSLVLMPSRRRMQARSSGRQL